MSKRRTIFLSLILNEGTTDVNSGLIEDLLHRLVDRAIIRESYIDYHVTTRDDDWPEYTVESLEVTPPTLSELPDEIAVNPPLPYPIRRYERVAEEYIAKVRNTPIDKLEFDWQDSSVLLLRVKT